LECFWRKGCTTVAACLACCLATTSTKMDRVDLPLSEHMPHFKLKTQLVLHGRTVTESTYNVVVDSAHVELEDREHHQHVSDE
jgi:hypothetical protein